MQFEERKYQNDAIERAVELFQRKVRRFIFQAPTGAGKTLLAAKLIQRALLKNSRILFLAHRLELLDQPYVKLAAMSVPEDKLGIIRSGEKERYRTDAPVQIASIMSLANKTEQRLPKADIIFVDECHRSVARTYQSLLSKYPKATIVGLSATPSRLDGVGLGDVFEEIIVVAQPSELIAAGYIVEPTVYTVPKELLPDLSEVGMSGGDYNANQLGEAVRKNKRRVGSIVEHWLQRAKGIRTIAFAVNIEDSIEIVRQFTAAGVKAVHVSGKTSEKDRKQALDDLRAHRIDVLSAAELFVEGLDVPEAKCAIMARPTESLTIWLQSCGRIVRPFEGQSAILLDHAGNAEMRHGHPSIDHEFSLFSKKRSRSTTGRSLTKPCPECGALVSLGKRQCNACGSFFEVSTQEISTLEGQLVEMRRDPEAERKAFWNRTWMHAYEEGHKPEWAVNRYKERFGEPPKDYSPPPRPKPPTLSEEEKQKEILKLYAIAHRQGLSADWAEKKFEARFGIKPPSGEFVKTAAATKPEPESPPSPIEDRAEGELS